MNLPEDVYDAARSLAAVRGISMGEALAEMVRRGLNAQCRVNDQDRFPHFVVPADAAPLTLEKTFEAEDEP